MGLPKATLELPNGELMLNRVYRAVSALKLPTTLIGRGPITDEVKGLEQISDAPDVVGPLSGILAAMHHDQEATWIILACDLPRIEPEAVQWLIDQRSEALTAILPRLSERRVEPLFALYEPAARELLLAISKSGSPAPKRLASEPRVDAPEPPRDLRSCWTNINTPDDVAALSGHRA